MAHTAGAVEYADCISTETPSHLIVKFRSWSFRECGVLLYYYYFKLRPGVIGLIRVRSTGQIEQFNHLLHLELSKCVQTIN